VTIAELGGPRDLTTAAPLPGSTIAHAAAPRAGITGRKAPPRRKLPCPKPQSHADVCRGSRSRRGMLRERPRGPHGNEESGWSRLDGEVRQTPRPPTSSPAAQYRPYFRRCFRAEQSQLIAAAVSLSVGTNPPLPRRSPRSYPCTRLHPVGSDYAADIRLCGSHSGKEIGADGRPRWRCERPAMMRAAAWVDSLYPSAPTAPPRLCA